MKKFIITLVVALTFAATANAIKLQLPEVTSQEIREENAFIRAEGLKAWKAENEAKIAEQGKIEDLYFEILITATTFNNTLFPYPNYPRYKTRFMMGFSSIPWGFSKRKSVHITKGGKTGQQRKRDREDLQEEIHVVRVTKGSPAEKSWPKSMGPHCQYQWGI